MKLSLHSPWIILFFGAFFFVLTAWKSTGYHHGDEQHQILEWAGLKLGFNQPEDLPWEFRDQIRPCLQPTLAYIFISAITAVSGLLPFEGEVSPYTLAFILRLITSGLSFGVLTFLFLVMRKKVPRGAPRSLFLASFFFLWFLPYLSVRFSSETWGGLFLALALALFLWERTFSLKPFVFGLLLALSFLFRYQMALSILGFGLYILIFANWPIKKMILASLGFIGTIFLGFILDSWFYQDLVFSPWNYLNETILSSEGPKFGSLPWNFYLINFFYFPSKFIAYPIGILTIFLLVTRPKSLFLWLFIPFFIAHSFVPHKELRFMFPMAFLIPLLIYESYVSLRRFELPYRGAVLRGLSLIFLVLNLPLLILFSQKPAGVGRMEITQFIHNQHQEKEVHLIYADWANPYDPWHGLTTNFYLPEGMSRTRISSVCEVRPSLIQPNRVNLLVIRKFHKTKVDCVENLNSLGFDFKVQSIPEWMEPHLKHHDQWQNNRILELYQYEK